MLLKSRCIKPDTFVVGIFESRIQKKLSDVNVSVIEWSLHMGDMNSARQFDLKALFVLI